jgi:hypothetical protein
MSSIAARSASVRGKVTFYNMQRVMNAGVIVHSPVSDW